LVFVGKARGEIVSCWRAQKEQNRLLFCLV
jgi:hypothetical protein